MISSALWPMPTKAAAALICDVSINNSYGRDPSNVSRVALCAADWIEIVNENENENFHAHSPR